MTPLPTDAPIRPVSDAQDDDAILPFAVEGLDLRGRIVRLGPAIDAIIRRHAYPAPVNRLLGEAAALTVLLGSSLKESGRFQLQTRTNGAVDMLVVDFDAPDRLRAFARFDVDKIAAAIAAGKTLSADLLGRGHLAFTIEPGGDLARYQGVVALEGEGLQAAAHTYFEQSEQIPTIVRLAVAEMLTPEGAQWRAGGLIVQFLPSSEDRLRHKDLHPGGDANDARESDVDADADDAWDEGRALAGTVEDHELVDPQLSGERLLFRLFHERGVRVFTPQPVMEACRCTTENVASMLRGFSPEERADMVGDDGHIGVTCEFCSTRRSFELKDLL